MFLYARFRRYIEQQNWNRQIEIFEKNNGTHYFGQPEKEAKKVGIKKSSRAKVRDLKEKKRIKVLIDD